MTSTGESASSSKETRRLNWSLNDHIRGKMVSKSRAISLILLFLYSNNTAFGLRCHVCQDMNSNNPECRSPRSDKYVKDCTSTDPSMRDEEHFNDYERAQKSLSVEKSYLGWQCVLIEIRTNGIVKLARNCSPDCPSAGSYLGNNNYQMSIECCNTDSCNDKYYNSSSKIIITNMFLLSICVVLKTAF